MPLIVPSKAPSTPLGSFSCAWNITKQIHAHRAWNSSLTKCVGRAFTALANRRYKVTWHVGVYCDNASNMNHRVRWAAGGSVSTSDTQASIVLYRHHTGGQVQGLNLIAHFVGPATAGSVTVGQTSQNLDVLGVGIFGSSINVNTVLVEDIGGV